MRQYTSIIRAERDENGKLTIVNLDTPNSLEVPNVHALNHLRDKDLAFLRDLAPVFLKAMESNCFKFRFSASYHQLGRAVNHGNARYLLWCSAMEALYTSHNPEHKGKLVATERIKWFLGRDTPIYASDDIPEYIRNKPTITIVDVVDKVYEVRNYMAHGDKIPDDYFVVSMREGIGGGIPTVEVLSEALSFIVRHSLLRILEDDLLQNFRDATTTDAFFEQYGLTKSLLSQSKKGAAYCPFPIESVIRHWK